MLPDCILLICAFLRGEYAFLRDVCSLGLAINQLTQAPITETPSCVARHCVNVIINHWAVDLLLGCWHQTALPCR